MDIEQLAREALESRGLTADIAPEALAEARARGGPAPLGDVRDLRDLDWASIDNADTRDIDQLAFAERQGDGIRLLVAVADVASTVLRDSALDLQARRNTVTVYLPGRITPMLPELLSTDWTSLGPGQDRKAMVCELLVAADGEIEASDLYPAAVTNRAKLDYVSVSAAVPSAQIELQLEVGSRLGQAAERRGALEFTVDRVLPVVENGVLTLVEETRNVANEAVAHQMIAANAAAARFLHGAGFPVFQRVVRPPERWDRMRELAPELPDKPDPRALGAVLREHRDPQLSEAMLKLMGGGDYVVTPPGEPLQGHFGQGNLGYLHSTAPNRRLPDILVQRLLQAALAGQPCPYTVEELQTLADHCNTQESKARGAERQVRKAVVAEYLTSQVGQRYQAVVTGNTRKGVFVKTQTPPIEGKLLAADPALDVGSHVEVRLHAVDTVHGFIDFVAVAP